MRRITLVIHLRNRDPLIESMDCESEIDINSAINKAEELRTALENDVSKVYTFNRLSVITSEITAFSIYNKEVIGGK